MPAYRHAHEPTGRHAASICPPRRWGVALLAMYSVAGNEGLGRSARFALLVALGGTVLVGWPGTALAQPYAERRPQRMKWGKPTVADTAQIQGSPAPRQLTLNPFQSQSRSTHVTASSRSAAQSPSVSCWESWCMQSQEASAPLARWFHGHAADNPEAGPRGLPALG